METIIDANFLLNTHENKIISLETPWIYAYLKLIKKKKKTALIKIDKNKLAKKFNICIITMKRILKELNSINLVIEILNSADNKYEYLIGEEKNYIECLKVKPKIYLKEGFFLITDNFFHKYFEYNKKYVNSLNLYVFFLIANNHFLSLKKIKEKELDLNSDYIKKNLFFFKKYKDYIEILLNKKLLIKKHNKIYTVSTFAFL